MIQVKNGDNKTIRYNGKIEGMQIFSHLFANNANTALSQPNYDACTFDWKCRLRNGQTIQVFSGRLNLLVQTMMLLTVDITKRIQYINAQVGQILVPASSSVNEKAIADLSFFCSVLDGEHEIIVRTGEVFSAGNSDQNSYINIDFNPSDDEADRPFILRQDNIEYGSSVKTINIVGVVGGMVYVQSDNRFIANNNGAFNGQSEHPLALVTCSSPLFNSMLHGDELQCLLCDDVDGIADFANQTTLTLQKSLILSERDLLESPQLDLQINSASMVQGVSYNIVSKVYV